MEAYKSLYTAYQPKENAFGFLRLILALFVVIQHGFVLNGLQDPLSKIGFISFGALGVNGFFILSGFLITASWLNNPSVLNFTIKRILRIFPAYWICLLFTSFLISNIIKINPTTNLFPEQITYFIKNFILIINQPDIGNLTKNLNEHSLNGSLWTLAYEFGLYILLAIAGLLGLIRRKILITAIIFIYIITYWLSDCKCTIFFKYYTSTSIAILPYLFGVGIIFYLYLDKIPFKIWLFILCALLIPIDVIYNKNMPLYPFLFGYVLLWLSIKLPFKSIEKIGDFSYGIYIYHFPIIQLILILNPEGINTALLILLTLLPTVILAFLSWNFIEKPALKFKYINHKK